MSSPHNTYPPFAEAGTTAVVAIAHPDDEFLVGGAINNLVQNGVNTHILIATSGEASTRGEPSFVASRGRELEGRLALQAYGIPPEHQHFLQLPDGMLDDQVYGSALTRTMGDILSALNVASIVTLGSNGVDRHTDHVAVHASARDAAAGHAGPGHEVRLFGLNSSNPYTYIATDPRTKLGNLSYHASQFTIDTSNPTYRPVPATIEIPGVKLSPETRQDLDRYSLYVDLEPYDLELFRSVGSFTIANYSQLARV